MPAKAASLALHYLRLHPGFGHRRGQEYGRELRPESQVFLCTIPDFFGAPQAQRLAVTLLAPASFLALLPHRPQLMAPTVSVSASHRKEHLCLPWFSHDAVIVFVSVHVR